MNDPKYVFGDRVGFRDDIFFVVGFRAYPSDDKGIVPWRYTLCPELPAAGSSNSYEDAREDEIQTVDAAKAVRFVSLSAEAGKFGFVVSEKV